MFRDKDYRNKGVDAQGVRDKGLETSVKGQGLRNKYLMTIVEGQVLRNKGSV
jgi:hypothetical protein